MNTKEFDLMVDTVYDWLLEEDPETQKEFSESTRDSLIRYHHSLGREIRNHFGLWEIPWEPKIVNGFDMSIDHPDAISMMVIESVWEKANS